MEASVFFFSKKMRGENKGRDFLSRGWPVVRADFFLPKKGGGKIGQISERPTLFKNFPVCGASASRICVGGGSFIWRKLFIDFPIYINSNPVVSSCVSVCGACVNAANNKKVSLLIKNILLLSNFMLKYNS